MTQNQQDSVWIFDGSELITYVSNEVRKAIIEMSDITTPIPYNKFTVKQLTESIVENSIYNIMRNELGYVVTYTENPITDVIKLSPQAEKHIRMIYKYVGMIIYRYLTDTTMLNIDYHYFTKVMIVNKNIHIRVTK